MKYQHQIFLKNRETLLVSAEAFSQMEDAIVSKSDEILDYSGVLFHANDVRFVKRIFAPDYQQVNYENFAEISDQQREDNLSRLAVLKAMFFSRKPGEVEEWVNPYSEGVKSTMSKEELRAFRKEFFDVAFSSPEHEEQTIIRWLQYERGLRDPRAYQRREVLASFHTGLTI